MPSPKKQKMNREVLEKNGIYFEEEVVGARYLPDHVQSLRAAILDFDCTIPDRLSCDTDSELESLEAEGFRDVRLTESDRSALVDTLRECTEAKEEAMKLTRGRDREAEWVDHYVKWFFDPLSQGSQVKDEDTRQISRTKFYYDYFERAKGRPWTLFGKHCQFRNGYSGLTEPKPDWVAYFPIYDFTAGDRIPDSRRWRWMNSPKASIVDNFTKETLQALAEEGLQCNAANIFRQGRKNSIVMSDYLCFPWLIVEHKKSSHEGQSIFCYCQAANAGMAALMMLQRLAKYTDKREDEAHVPPVITITTIDGVVRVWVMYVTEGGEAYEMKCIWEGDMTKLIDHLKLQAILENCHTWAVRVLRPWISGYIDLWKNKSSSEKIPIPGNNASGDIRHGLTEEGLALIRRLTLEVEGDPANDSEEEDALVSTLRDMIKKEFGFHHDQIRERLGSSLLDPVLRKQTASSTRDFGTQTDIEPRSQNEKSNPYGSDMAEPYISSDTQVPVSRESPSLRAIRTIAPSGISTHYVEETPCGAYVPPDKINFYKKKIAWNGKNIMINLPIISREEIFQTASTTQPKSAKASDIGDLSALYWKLKLMNGHVTNGLGNTRRLGGSLGSGYATSFVSTTSFEGTRSFGGTSKASDFSGTKFNFGISRKAKDTED